MDVYGCMQCHAPGPTDMGMLLTGLWALCVFSVVALASWVRNNRR